jgi:predicted transcriptional regulator
MKVEHLMSTPVIITQRHIKIGHLKDMLSRKKIGAVPVLEDDGTISGIVSASDVLKATDDDIVVQDIMSDRVHIALKNNRVKDAAGMMAKNDVHHLVVMEDGQVVGMLSALDVVRVYAEE